MLAPLPRRRLATIALLAGASVLPLVATGHASDPTSPTGCAHVASPQVRHGATGGRRVALTFDDGPGALTPKFLAILEREQVPATFFVVGRHVAGREATLRRMLAGGDMIGNHSFTHVSLAQADDAALAEIADTQEAIRTATGFTPCLLRPPFGLSSHALVDALNAQGLTSILWSVDPKDFLSPGTAKIRDRVLAGVKPGAIVISHDGGARRQTLAALPGIIKGLKRRGYRFVTVTDLLGLAVTRG